MLDSKNHRRATLLVLLGTFAIAVATTFARWQGNSGGSDEISTPAPALNTLEPSMDLATPKTARELYKSGEYRLAAESFARTAKLEPMDARHQNDAGHAFWKAKDYDNALAHLEIAVQMSPAILRFANNLATLYVDTGREDEALALLLKTHQNTASAHYNIGFLYLQRKRREDAIKHLTIALSHNPDLEVASLWLTRLNQENAPDELMEAYLSP